MISLIKLVKTGKSNLLKLKCHWTNCTFCQSGLPVEQKSPLGGEKGQKFGRRSSAVTARHRQRALHHWSSPLTDWQGRWEAGVTGWDVEEDARGAGGGGRLKKSRESLDDSEDIFNLWANNLHGTQTPFLFHFAPCLIFCFFYLLFFTVPVSDHYHIAPPPHCPPRYMVGSGPVASFPAGLHH